MHHVIQWSGGIGSWAATELVRHDHPDDPITLLFADVKIEDSDLYRFNADASARLGIPITRVCDGRTPFELFVQRSYLGNARIAPCSQALKQRPCRRWLTEHTDPADTVLYVGLEPGEQRRVPAITAGWRPWRVEYPLMQHPGLTKDDLLAWCRHVSLEPPRLYEFGFSHNNCGGLCVRGGQAHWRRTHDVFPDRFAWYAQLEQDFRDTHGDVAILKRRHHGQTQPLPLRDLHTDSFPAAAFTELDLEHILRLLGLGERPEDRRRRLAVGSPTARRDRTG
ncbi:hypothetical protein [Amycolatopsis sp. cmx-8-4]|uniref:hypothetical protein n=1 Tax=Amycolatopsis sp. cmx-8-4 TaxID=2790947 RepID=UPI00397AB19D